MKLAVILLLTLLYGCGSIDGFKNSQDTDYVLLSYSKAGGMYKLITGETEACKLTKHGVSGLEYTLEPSSGECSVSASK